MVKKIVILITLLLVLLNSGCNNYGQEVEDAKNLIQKEDWQQAKAVLEKIPMDYNEEIPLLSNYVEAKIVLTSNNGSEFEKAKTAYTILEYSKIDSIKKSEIAKETEDLRRQLATQIEETISKTEVEEKAIVDKGYILWKDVIKSSNRASALNQSKVLLKDYDKLISKYKEDAHILYLYTVQAELIDDYRENMSRENAYDSNGDYDDYRSYGREFADKHKMEIIKHLKDINPNTQGASEFIPDVLWNLKIGLENFIEITESDWEDIYNNYDEKMKEDIEQDIEKRKQLKTMTPQIGMTEGEVTLTKWGEPEDINKTTTSYGVSEQWVYEVDYNRKYVYLENGIVTAIQD